MNGVTVHGFVAEGWTPVADAFSACFTEHHELGAAVSVYVDGAPVVDLWGGVADASSGREWRQDTVVPTFSTTKGITALCALRLVDEGLLDLDAPVATYWPEFAAGGKSTIPVRWLLTHQAGLPFVDADLTLDDLEDESVVMAALASQTPYWEPGSHFAYHAVTYGHLVGEVVRRVTGLHLRDFFAREVADPLGLHAWIGLPADLDVDLARLERVTHETPPLPEPMLVGRRHLERAISLGSALPVALVDGSEHDFNDRRMLAVPLSGSSLVSDARSIARTYAAAVGLEGREPWVSRSLLEAAQASYTADLPYFAWPEALRGFCPFEFGLGVTPLRHLATPSFGHGGAGGSLGWGNLEARVGFGYITNRMEAANPDQRSLVLTEAVRRCLEG